MNIKIWFICFLSLSFAVLKSSVASEMVTLSLKSAFQLSQDAIDFRIEVARKIKRLIENTINVHGKLGRLLQEEATKAHIVLTSEEIQASKGSIDKALARKIIKIIPVQNPHYTHLFLGDVPKRDVCCVQRSLKGYFTQLMFTPRVLLPIVQNIPFMLLEGMKKIKRYFIVLHLKDRIDPAWERITKDLNDVIERDCQVRLTHFITYQKDDIWVPHISFMIIEAIKPTINLKRIFNMPYSIQGRETTLKKSIEALLQNISQENMQKRNNLGTLNLGDMALNAPGEVLETIVYDQRYDKWQVNITQVKQEEQIQNIVQSLHQVTNMLDGLKIYLKN